MPLKVFVMLSIAENGTINMKQIFRHVYKLDAPKFNSRAKNIISKIFRNTTEGIEQLLLAHSHFSVLGFFIIVYRFHF